MLRPSIVAAALAAGALVPTLSYADKGSNPPIQVDGGRLVSTSRMTLYTFDKDAAGAGKSTCNETCAENWPPLQADGTDRGKGDYSVVARDDGSKQWAYKGKPLYFWGKDTKPGETNGDGVKGVWHVAKP